MRRVVLVRWLLVGLLVAAGAFLLAAVPAREVLTRTLEVVDGIGPAGPVVLAAVYAVACVLLLPGWVLTLGAGFLFGLVVGTVAVSVGSVVGATLAFLVGRTWGRDWVERRLADWPRFRAIDRAVGRHGFQVVLLLRLSPVFPFNLLNYAFGLTRVRFRDYVLASWVGMLPGTVLYVYLGSALKSLAEVAAGGPKASPVQRAFFFVGLLVTVAATVVLTRMARRALQAAVEEPDVRPAAASTSPVGTEEQTSGPSDSPPVRAETVAPDRERTTRT